MSRYLFLTFFLLQSLVLISQNTLIKANYHYDSEKGIFGGKLEILIKRNKITEVGSNLEYDIPNTTIIDLGDFTLLPGLIDSHTHLFTEEKLHPDYTGFGETVVENALSKSDVTRALEAAYNAKSYLDAGFTSVIDLGNSGQYLDVDLRDAISKGYVSGSRIFVSGPGIAAIGGQVNNYNKNLEEIVNKEYQIITGESEAIKAVRDHALKKVDLIKLYADNIPNKTSLNINELKEVIKEAKHYNLRVTAHAITNEAVFNAANAGVNSIEHAYSFADSTLALIKDKEITVVPTFSDEVLAHQMFKRYGIDNEGRRNKIIARSKKRQKETLERLYHGKIDLVFGSDFYSKVDFNRGKAAKHCLYSWLEADLPLETVLKCATYNAGKHLQLKDKLGVIKSGALADIIAVPGELKKDYKLLNDVRFIMKSGEIIKLDID